MKKSILTVMFMLLLTSCASKSDLVQAELRLGMRISALKQQYEKNNEYIRDIEELVTTFLDAHAVEGDDKKEED